MNILFIKELSVYATIGVYGHEREIKQELKIDMEIDFNIHAAGATDDIADAIDYEAISNRTLEYVGGSKHFLIEAVAENLSQLLLNEFPIEQLTLTISKPGAVKNALGVGIKITRP